ncbi:MAG: DUF2066 domain-containing protein [Gammaproteobacteria bacterium]|nr:DUF2066 domain-containing protein [Gammaproteobacteria bacterium]
MKYGIVHALLPGYEISMRQIVKNLQILSVYGLITAVLLISTPASAVVVEHLYEAEIAVSDQTRKTRHEVFKKAFQQTLIKVVGSSRILGNPMIDDARDKVLKYISQFRYRDLPEGFVQPVAAENVEAAAVYTNMLWIKFDVPAINALLSSSQLPVWGRQRPETLVWIAVRDGAQRYVLKRRDISPIKDEIEKAARLRGLPILWPEYDDEDRSRLSFVDLWGGFWDNILTVSRRYDKESMLVGRYFWAGNEWQVKWDLLGDKHQQYWQINSRDLDLLSSAGIDNASDKISPRYALFLRESSGGNFYLDVHGISNTDRYATITTYLRGLSPIKDLNVSEVSAQGMRFKIDAQGSVDDVKRLIALGSLLKPVNVQVTTQHPLQGDVVLAYELR